MPVLQAVNTREPLETSKYTLEESRSSGLSPEPPWTGDNKIYSPEKFNENYQTTQGQLLTENPNINNQDAVGDFEALFIHQMHSQEHISMPLQYLKQTPAQRLAATLIDKQANGSGKQESNQNQNRRKSVFGSYFNGIFGNKVSAVN